MPKLHEYGMMDASMFNGVYISKNEFDDIVSENMDLSDMQTLNTICSINEADRAAVLTSLTSKLYDNIVDKVDDIDFGSIETSKGDITKIENYERLLECIELMRSIVKEYHQDTDCIDVVADAVTNIRSRTKLWEKCYQMNLELPIITYQTMTMACVSSISLLIATSIEFIKNTDGSTYAIALDKVAFNKTCVFHSVQNGIQSSFFKLKNIFTPVLQFFYNFISVAVLLFQKRQQKHNRTSAYKSFIKFHFCPSFAYNT